MPPGSRRTRSRTPTSNTEPGRIRWIGGSPCSGKSTVAARLAAKYGCTHYCVDDHFETHGRRLGARAPTFEKVLSLPIGDRLSQPISTQVNDVSSLAEEEFGCILEDLDALPGDVIVEGAALLPRLLAGHAVSADQAIWLVPTEEFQRRHYGRRGWAQNLVRDLEDPAHAFEQWMQRDAAYAQLVHEEAQRLGYRVLIIDGSETVDEVVARQFLG